ncbi:hypothetical protein PMIN04_010751, partial [Paraphaeosphaeria minitans]
MDSRALHLWIMCAMRESRRSYFLCPLALLTPLPFKPRPSDNSALRFEWPPFLVNPPIVPSVDSKMSYRRYLSPPPPFLRNRTPWPISPIGRFARSAWREMEAMCQDISPFHCALNSQLLMVVVIVELARSGRTDPLLSLLLGLIKIGLVADCISILTLRMRRLSGSSSFVAFLLCNIPIVTGPFAEMALTVHILREDKPSTANRFLVGNVYAKALAMGASCLILQALHARTPGVDIRSHSPIVPWLLSVSGVLVLASAPHNMVAFLDPVSCAGRKDGTVSDKHSCQNVAKLVCSSCKLVQYCTKECQAADWPRHKKICKSYLMKSKYVPGWVIEGRNPSWVSDSELSSNFGTNQYLWGNMPAVNMLNVTKTDTLCDSYRDTDVLFAASGDIRNVVKTVVEGLPDEYHGRCTLVINDINFTVVARNAILLFVALSLAPEEAVPIMIHVWYSALLPRAMLDTIRRVALGPIMDVCEKIKDKPVYSIQAKTLTFGQRILRIVLKKNQWNELKEYFDIPPGLTSEDAQVIRRRVMLAPERIDYLHRALCNQTPPIRVATVTFREDGILLPHGASRKQFDTPNT